MRTLKLILVATLVTIPPAATAQPVVIVFIKVAQVHDLVTRGRPPVLVDVRSRDEYEARHITGAISIPLNEIAHRAAEIPRYPLVVLY